MRHTMRAEAVVDLDAASATTAFIWIPSKAGQLYVKQIFARVEEVVAAGGFSSAAGVASVTAQPNGGSEVDLCTISTGVAATARAIGDEMNVTVDTTNVDSVDGCYTYAANTAFRVKTKTQGTGGTVTGTLRFYLPYDVNEG